LVPFVASTTSHQIDNAQFMAAQGAALHLPQQTFSASSLADLLRGLTRTRCQDMAEHAYRCGRRQANETIADELEQLAGISS
jgi:UDP-N-acetylglucosamine--N-acetylmuramyl-(pentapeptide) pyrophosphoryl-undecaprenol N-acetylglucosamine transferase